MRVLLTKRQLHKKTLNTLKTLRIKATFIYAGVNPSLFKYKLKHHILTPLEERWLTQYVRWTKPTQLFYPDAPLPKKIKAKKKVLVTASLRKPRPSLRITTAALKRFAQKAYKNAAARPTPVRAVTPLHQLRRARAHSRPLAKSAAQPYKPIILHRDFFKFADGVYSSYWLGRLINMFTRQGKKKTITNQVQHAMLHLKFKYQTIPLLILYELLETLKPVFLLRKYKIRRTQIVEYPYVAKNSRRYMRVLQWIRRELQNESRRMSSYSSFPERLYNKLSMAHDSPRSHSLIKTRDAHNAHSNMSQFNIRYNWKRNRRW